MAQKFKAVRFMLAIDSHGDSMVTDSKDDLYPDDWDQVYYFETQVPLPEKAGGNSSYRKINFVEAK